MTTLLEHIEKIRSRIDNACKSCDRDPSSIELLPVSKQQPIALLQEAIALGFNKFGENYVQEGVKKNNAIGSADFVLIGPLQRNKVKQALMNFQEIMTVDSPQLLERLQLLSEQLKVTRPIWIQVNLWAELTKIGGCDQSNIAPILKLATKDNSHLPLMGFMVIPPPNNLEAFTVAAQLRDQWQQALGRNLKLSMGMSTDLEPAIQAGSDQIRIGTAFFGNMR